MRTEKAILLELARLDNILYKEEHTKEFITYIKAKKEMILWILKG